MSESYRNTSISLPEVLAKVVALEGTLEDKSELLKKYDNDNLRWFVHVMYSAPLGGIEIPKYVESQYPVGNHYMSIQSAKSKLEWIISNKTAPNAQRQLKLILENVHKDEAVLIVNLLSGKKVEGISKGVWKRSFPEYFPVNSETTLEETQEE